MLTIILRSAIDDASLIRKRSDFWAAQVSEPIELSYAMAAWTAHALLALKIHSNKRMALYDPPRRNLHSWLEPHFESQENKVFAMILGPAIGHPMLLSGWSLGNVPLLIERIYRCSYSFTPSWETRLSTRQPREHADIDDNALINRPYMVAILRNHGLSLQTLKHLVAYVR